MRRQGPTAPLPKGNDRQVREILKKTFKKTLKDRHIIAAEMSRDMGHDLAGYRLPLCHRAGRHRPHGPSSPSGWRPWGLTSCGGADGHDLQPMFAEIGEVMVNSTRQRFDDEEDAQGIYCTHWRTAPSPCAAPHLPLSSRHYTGHAPIRGRASDTKKPLMTERWPLCDSVIPT
ncbi:MAG: hypothetical protein HQL53_10390 [Magnetococcales bacterium]|nr:hypothetical protein [Magnetococcales bacterium]